MFFGKNKKQDTPLPAAEARAAAAPAEDHFFENPNRRRCEELLRIALLEGQGKKRGGVLKLYLENFKLFNDTFGYDYGGMLLREVVEYLNQVSENNAYRFDGVEFLVILDGWSYARVTELAEKILDRFEQTWNIRGFDCMVGMDLGILFYPDWAETPEEVLKNLEHAVVESGSRGQNQMTIYDQDLRDKIHRRQSIAQTIQKALDEDAIEVRYRPTYHSDQDRFVRAECYLRLNSEEFGTLYSSEFLPIAEELGLICAVDRFAIRKACEMVGRLMALGKDFESIAVPISPVMFLQESFVSEVQDCLKEYQIPPEKLAFEITESVLINSFAKVNLVMQELSELGVEFVLNEFGTGYSGINSILDLPVKVLKLERLFVAQLEINPRSGYIIEGLIRIAHNLGMKIIAEGVETDHQVELLERFGCKYAQGFYYSATVTPEELAPMLDVPSEEE